MSLNIMCAICNEFYKTSDSVYTSMCGHLFHHHCLFRWLARNNTCPQCRNTCHRRVVHRVYLNFGDATAEDEIDSDIVSPQFLKWTLLENLDVVPEGAIKCGTDADGNDAYVARVYYNDDLLPANYVPNKAVAYTPWGCHARIVNEDIEILLHCEFSWVAATNGQVPENAIVTGYTEMGEDLYTGRGQHEGIQLGGKVHQSHGVLYMPYKEQEVNVREYEVLVRNK